MMNVLFVYITSGIRSDQVLFCFTDHSVWKEVMNYGI